MQEITDTQEPISNRTNSNRLDATTKWKQTKSTQIHTEIYETHANPRHWKRNRTNSNGNQRDGCQTKTHWPMRSAPCEIKDKEINAESNKLKLTNVTSNKTKPIRCPNNLKQKRHEFTQQSMQQTYNQITSTESTMNQTTENPIDADTCWTNTNETDSNRKPWNRHTMK